MSLFYKSLLGNASVFLMSISDEQFKYMLRTDAWKTLCCHSFEILVPVLCKMSIWEFQWCSQDRTFCASGRMVWTVIDGFLFCITQNLCCKSSCMAKLVQHGSGLTGGGGRGRRLSLHLWDYACGPSGSIPCFTHGNAVFAWMEAYASCWLMWLISFYLSVS